MSTQPSPFDETPAQHAELFSELSSMASHIENDILDLEPKARELNRHLVALFGPCRTSETGCWVSIHRTQNGEVCFAVEPISSDKVLSVVARLSEIESILEDSEPSFPASKFYQSDLGPAIIGEGAALSSVPGTHVRTVK
jgi:hypothetical protein